MFEELVRKARSTRRFDTADPLAFSDLRAWVNVARLAPSASNQQPIRYRIVHGAECAKLFPATKWAGALKKWNGPTDAQQPTGYIALASDADAPAPGVDLGIAAMTLQLAAADTGWAACMLGAFDPNVVNPLLAIPQPWTVRLLVAFGRAAEKIELVEGLAPDGPRYWRDENGTHFVPKRLLSDVLLPAPE